MWLLRDVQHSSAVLANSSTNSCPVPGADPGALCMCRGMYNDHHDYFTVLYPSLCRWLVLVAVAAGQFCV